MPRGPTPRRHRSAGWAPVHEGLIPNPFVWERVGRLDRWTRPTARTRTGRGDRRISSTCFNAQMIHPSPGPRPSIRTTFAHLCRDTRLRLGISQETLSGMAGVSRGQIAKIELGHADPSLEVAERLAVALGLELELLARQPILLEPRQRDGVHARCSGYADRRLVATMWQTAREVEIVHARSHGWIDLLAFDPRTGLVLVVEIKTRLDDLGLIERQLAWYERSAFDLARRLGWPARRVAVWLLALASEEVDLVVRANRQVLSHAFPVRAIEMSAIARGGTWPANGGRGLALIDPTSRRRDWLIRCRADGRRSPAPYVDYADAARRLAG
jgi:transcriptional regulator with XRE-family HTH domain